jgi:hypothetical protein
MELMHDRRGAMKRDIHRRHAGLDKAPGVGGIGEAPAVRLDHQRFGPRLPGQPREGEQLRVQRGLAAHEGHGLVEPCSLAEAVLDGFAGEEAPSGGGAGFLLGAEGAGVVAGEREPDRAHAAQGAVE